MRENKMRTTLLAGGEVVTGWCGIPSSVSAELMAKLGFDAITIDMQHGAVDYADMLHMLQAISTSDATPIVRAPWNDPSFIGRILDAGAYGVICPMINSGDDADAFVRACRYAPVGQRSAGPLRASLYGGPDYIKMANETIMTFAMIETVEGLNNLEDILKAPGLDAIFVGPSDLSLAMGGPAGFDPRTPAVYEAIEFICAKTIEAGIIPGIHTGSVQYAKEMRELGYRFMAYLSDFRMLQSTVTRALPLFKAGTPDSFAP
ncbi:MAG TPA: aldolase/citrate lyase family protein [Xanthobacteraceae bacterium]|nr:aldolase/citrate lyase family protein [Xanthobacteraceae bacterium]